MTTTEKRELLIAFCRHTNIIVTETWIDAFLATFPDEGEKACKHINKKCTRMCCYCPDCKRFVPHDSNPNQQ